MITMFGFAIFVSINGGEVTGLLFNHLQGMRILFGAHVHYVANSEMYSLPARVIIFLHCTSPLHVGQVIFTQAIAFSQFQ